MMLYLILIEMDDLELDLIIAAGPHGGCFCLSDGWATSVSAICLSSFQWSVSQTYSYL